MTSKEQSKEFAMKKHEEPAVPETTASDVHGVREDGAGFRYSDEALKDPHHNAAVSAFERALGATGVWATPGDHGEAPLVADPTLVETEETEQS